MALSIRRALKTVLAARDGRGPPVQIAVIGAALQVLADLERYCGATRGINRAVKPLLLPTQHATDPYDAIERVIASIEQTYP